MYPSMLFMYSAIFLASSAYADTPKGFTGSYDCPAYKGKDNEWNAHQVTMEDTTVVGTRVIGQKYEGDLKDKTGPYVKDYVVVDNMWRYFPLYRAGKLYPVKTKTRDEGDKILWDAEYPDIEEKKGKKRKAGTGQGSFWLDTNGDLVSTGSHYTGEYRCKKVTSKK